MKTLFINPNNRNPSPEAAIEPPLWLSLMASHYLEDGKDVKVLDAEAENLNFRQTKDAVLKESPDEVIIVVMGNNPSVSSTPKMRVATTLLEILKKNCGKTYLTGLHPMAVGSQFTLEWRPTKCLPLHWELLPMHLYRAHNWHCLGGIPRQPYASTYTSLGCPFDCYYCNIHTLYKTREILYRGITSIVTEVDTLVKRYGIKNIKIWDELFTLRDTRVLSICSILQSYDLNIWAYARLDTVTSVMLKAMKKAGINWLAYGFESVTDKKFSKDRVERVIAMTRDAGINIMGNFMFGLPGETLETAETTLSFAKEHLLEFVNFYVALPYPGSQWYWDTKDKDKADEFDQYGHINSPWTEFRDRAFKEYFTNPDYQAMVKGKFGEVGLEEINEMLSWDIQKSRRLVHAT